jgi:hypothetical protein
MPLYKILRRWGRSGSTYSGCQGSKELSRRITQARRGIMSYRMVSMGRECEKRKGTSRMMSRITESTSLVSASENRGRSASTLEGESNEGAGPRPTSGRCRDGALLRHVCVVGEKNL